MHLTTIKTHKIVPGESIFSLLDYYLPRVCEHSIVAIASKIISICENRLISKNHSLSKSCLIKKEADWCFPAPTKRANFYLTLKDGRLIPNAGIDESNCKNFYVLLPAQPQLTAQKIWRYLRQKQSCKNLGIIITDSNITPLRSGVTGITIGWCGFKPLYNYIGKKDLFCQTLKVTKINLLDSLATVATLAMGEGAEQTPLAVINGPPKTLFQNRIPNKKEKAELKLSSKQDLFSPVISYD